jgi:hypothetical protein
MPSGQPVIQDPSANGFAIPVPVIVRFHPMRQVGRRLHPARAREGAHFWPTKDRPQLWCFARFQARQRAYRADASLRNCQPTILKELPVAGSIGGQTSGCRCQTYCW